MCFVGRAAGESTSFILATVYVKLKVLNFITGKVKT